MQIKQFRANLVLYILVLIGLNNINANNWYITKNCTLTILAKPMQSQKCQGINSKGKPCGNKAKKNSKFCDFHDPNRIKCKAIASSTHMQCKNSPSSTCSGYCSIHCDQGENQ